MTFTIAATARRSLTLLKDNLLLLVISGLCLVVIPTGIGNYLLLRETHAPLYGWAQGFGVFTPSDWLWHTTAYVVALSLTIANICIVTDVAIRRVMHHTITTASLVQNAVKLTAPLFAISIVVKLVMYGGFILLFVPGIMFAMAASVALPAHIGEPNLGIWESVKRSFELTRHHRWQIFLIMFAIGGLNIVVNLGLLKWMTGTLIVNKSPDALMFYLRTILGTLLWLVVPIVTAAIYIGLRESKDDFGSNDVADVFN